jgi:hypothetical protein
VLRILVSGADAEAAASAVADAVAAGETGAVARIERAAESGEGRKLLDPVSVATLIVSLPAAALAVADLVDRLRKRQTAQAIIDAAKKAQEEGKAEATLIGPDGRPHALGNLTPDALLEIAAGAQIG